MVTRKTKPASDNLFAEALTEGIPAGYEKIVRATVFEKIKVQSDVTDFDSFIDTAQKIALELFLNQAAICLKNQRDYMNRDRPLQNIEDYRILNITSDIMRELTAYDFGVDTNKAIEFLTRQGFDISDGSQSE